MAVDEPVQQRLDAQPLHHGAGVPASRGHGDLEARLSALPEELQRPWQQVAGAQLADEGLVGGVLVGHPLLHLLLGGGPAVEKQLQRPASGDPAERFVPLSVEGDAQFVGQLLPGAVVVLRGVGQHSIQVEDDGSDLGHLVNSRARGIMPVVRRRASAAVGGGTVRVCVHTQGLASLHRGQAPVFDWLRRSLLRWNPSRSA